MRYQDRNFQRMQDRQRLNPKESKRDFLIRTGREKKHLRFYKEIAYKAYDTDSWHCLSDKQRDEIIDSWKQLKRQSLLTGPIYLYFTPYFESQEDWFDWVKEKYRPDPALLRQSALKKIGI